MHRLALAAILLVPTAPADSLAQVPSNAQLVWERGTPSTDQPRRIWISDLAGKDPRPLTEEGARFPTWSPAGDWISYHHEKENSGHIVRPDGSGDRRICEGRPAFWLLREAEIVCISEERYVRVEPSSGRSSVLLEASSFSALGGKSLDIAAISPDLRFAVAWSDRYKRRYAGDNGALKSFHTAILLDLHDRSKVYAIGPGCEPTLSADGEWIYHVGQSGQTAPDIFRVPTRAVLEPDFLSRPAALGWAAEVELPDDDWGHTYFPRLSAGDENNWVTYSATSAAPGEQACHDHDTCAYQVFLHRVGSPTTERLRVTGTRNGNGNGDSNTWPHLWVGTP